MTNTLSSLGAESIENSTPIRFQRKRQKGWKMPACSRCVTRPGKYGNPHNLGTSPEQRDEATRLFEADLVAGRLPYTVADLQRTHRGYNLGCFCRIDGHGCHADILLKYANQEAAR